MIALQAIGLLLAVATTVVTGWFLLGALVAALNECSGHQERKG